VTEIGGRVKQAGSLAKKVYGILWLITMIGFIVTLGGFYLEFRKLTGQVAKVEAMVNAIGEKVIGAAEWKEKAEGQLDNIKEKTGGLLDKLGK
jgi:hypothetical protein